MQEIQNIVGQELLGTQFNSDKVVTRENDSLVADRVRKDLKELGKGPPWEASLLLITPRMRA